MLKLDRDLPVFNLVVGASDLFMSDDCFCIWMLGSWTGRFKAGALRTVVLKDWRIFLDTGVSFLGP